jgi:hypothetical protein
MLRLAAAKKNKLFVFYITKIEIAFGSGNFRLWEGVSAKQTFLSFLKYWSLFKKIDAGKVYSWI